MLWRLSNTWFPNRSSIIWCILHLKLLLSFLINFDDVLMMLLLLSIHLLKLIYLKSLLLKKLLLSGAIYYIEIILRVYLLLGWHHLVRFRLCGNILCLKLSRILQSHILYAVYQMLWRDLLHGGHLTKLIILKGMKVVGLRILCTVSSEAEILILRKLSRSIFSFGLILMVFLGRFGIHSLFYTRTRILHIRCPNWTFCRLLVLIGQIWWNSSLAFFLAGWLDFWWFLQNLWANVFLHLFWLLLLVHRFFLFLLFLHNLTLKIISFLIFILILRKKLKYLMIF